MATDPTNVIAKDIKVLILSHTDQKTVAAASRVSRGWRIAADHYYHTALQNCGDLRIPLDLARDIDLEKFKTRLTRLIARKAPEFKKENEKHKSHATNSTVKLAQFGLFYPYVKKDLNSDLRNQAGIPESGAPKPTTRIRSGTIRPEQTAHRSHQSAIQTRATDNHDPYRAKKAEMLSQACIYGNAELFNLLLKHGAEPTVNNLNQAAQSGNRDICLTLLRRGLKPNQETVYFLVLTGNVQILKAALKKAPDFRPTLLNKRFELAAKASEQPEMSDYLDRLQTEARTPPNF
jgi:hypothetical protein